MTARASQGTAAIESVTLVSDPVPALQIRGSGAPPRAIELAGSRLRLPGRIAGGGSSTGWRATVPLLASRWGGPEVPPPSGTYRLRLADAPGPDVEAAHVGAAEPAADAAGAVPGLGQASGVPLASAASLPEPQFVPGLFRIAFHPTDAGLAVEFGPPLTDDEFGPAAQARLEERYRSAHPEPLDAVLFESFYGQNASCNPLALDREFARQRPELTRYWGVADASVAVPDGATPLIEGSAEWWRVRASVRLIVVNDWLRNRYRRRRHQTVLQTWHGTMLKRLALTRRRAGLRPALATIRERSRWSILLAQNDYAKAVFRRAYAFTGPIWTEGYPRDDLLLTGDPAEVRARLGIPDGVKVVLYAPTWRDDRPDHVDHLDVSRFAAALGPGWVTLIRGHSRTLRPGADLRAGGVLDVTSYPDISELFLVADALVTDYSSVMFDFSVTGKPIYFFTPDLDRYREVLRGFYFDLLPVAPGPVVQDAGELVELVRHPDAVRADYEERYATWRARFNPHDDGHAAERVVARLGREGVI